MRFIDDVRGMSGFLLLLIVFLDCPAFVACQTRRESVAASLKQCQQLLDKDDVIAANECFGKAIVANPQSAAEISKAAENSILDKCVELLEKKKNHEQAIVCFEGLSVLLPDKSSVFIYLAESYYKYNKAIDNKTDESLASAEEAIKKAIRLRPESAIAHETYGRILEQKGDLQGALKGHQEAVKLQPKDNLYLMGLAMIQDKMGNTNEAIASYQQALKIESNYELALYFLGNLYAKTGETDKAIETLDKLFELVPNYDEKTKQTLKSLKEKRDLEKTKKSKTKAAGNNRNK